MTILTRQRLVSAQLVLDLTAMTAPLPLNGKLLVFAMNTVRLSMFPSINISMCGVPGLVLVSFWMN
jgi:hypothetical protein